MMLTAYPVPYCLWPQEQRHGPIGVQKGVLILNAHNISLAFGRKELQIVLKAYSETLQKLSEAIASQTLREKLIVEPLVPLFKIR